MTIRRRNPRLQGLIGLGAAIDWFTRNGYFVAVLFILTDQQDIYVVPCHNVDGRSSLTLGAKYDRFRASGAQQMVVGEGFEPSKA